MPSLFSKIEQGNLYAELNINLPPTNLENATAVRRTIDIFVCPSNRRADTTTQLGIDPEDGSFRLPGQHGRRHGVPRPQRAVPDP